MTVSAKIRIKVGSTELECEGNSLFFPDKIEELLGSIGELASRVPDNQW
jgi:hypothetical protein